MPSVHSVRSAVRVSWLALLVVAVDVSALQAQRASGPLTLNLNWVANPRVNPIDQGSQVVHDLRGVASGRFKTFFLMTLVRTPVGGDSGIFGTNPNANVLSGTWTLTILNAKGKPVGTLTGTLSGKATLPAQPGGPQGMGTMNLNLQVTNGSGIIFRSPTRGSGSVAGTIILNPPAVRSGQPIQIAQFNGTVNLTFNVFDSRPLFQR
jgi:hypothetical protein